MGMRGPGEIALLTQIATPDIAVITNVGDGPYRAVRPLSRLLPTLNVNCWRKLPGDGVAVLNYDNARLMATAPGGGGGGGGCGQAVPSPTVLTGGDVRGYLVEQSGLSSSMVCRLPLPLPGQHNAQNVIGGGCCYAGSGAGLARPVGRTLR